MVEAVNPKRNLSRNPLVQIMFNLQPGSWTQLELADLSLSPMTMGQQAAQFDLTMRFTQFEEQLEGSVEYNTDLFDRDRMERMASHYMVLLEAVVADPEMPLADLPLLTDQERVQILETWNDTEIPRSGSQLLHPMVEAQVARNPDRMAVVCGERCLTYGQLNRGANGLALQLRRLGVGPDKVVAILLPRSPEVVMALLAILKAGGAYLILDLNYPLQRLNYLLKDSRARVVLEDGSGHAEKLSVGVPTLTIKPDGAPAPEGLSENIDSDCDPGQLAYLLYTSGSSGQPKGVWVCHASFANLCLFYQRFAGIGEATRVLQVTSLSFDASNKALVTPLISGGTLMLLDEGPFDPRQMLRRCHQQQAQVIDAVPSMIYPVLELAEPSGYRCLTSLRFLALGGEATDLAKLTPWLTADGIRCKLANIYGPTECTDLSLVYPTPSSDLEKTVALPLGRPVENIRIGILRPDLSLAPVGIPGELMIGGAGVARGYVHQPALTAARYLPDPRGDGARWYRTGDRAAWTPQGAVVFLGRLDNQVKIRGLRIELGEIEAAIAGHPQVAQTAVVVREDRPGHRFLAAYLVASDDGKTTLPQGELISQLRLRVEAHLPDYMVPATFKLLAEMPLTPNGKVDRRALPAPDPSEIRSATSFVGPRNPIEEMLADTFAELLNLPRVGIHENFFEIGGHSLMATQVTARIQESLGVEVPLAGLFEAATVAKISLLVEAARTGGRKAKLPVIEAASSAVDPPMSFVQQRLWFLSRMDASSTFLNLSNHFTLKGPLDVGMFQRSILEIYRRHQVLRATFKEQQGQPKQGFGEVENFTLDLLDFQAFSDPESQVRRLGLELSQKPFDLASGPLLRLLLVRLAPQNYVLFLTMHHIISDAWSLGILVAELGALYRAFSRDMASPLKELPIQYVDFSRWQQQLWADALLKPQLDYWKDQLAGDLPVLSMPGDFDASTIRDHRGTTLYLNLPEPLGEGIRTLSRQAGATLFMSLLTVFKILLHRFTGADDMIVGCPISGRHQPRLEQLLGCFLNTMALRTNLGGNPTFSELLNQVREKTLKAYEHQDLPFEKLVEELQPERSLTRHPIFDIMFNYMNTSQAQKNLELQGIQLGEFQVAEPDSQVSMTLYVHERGQSLTLKLTYKRMLFARDRMERFLRQYQYLLEQVVAEPDRAIKTYSLIEPLSRNLLPDLQETLAQPPQKPVADLFADLVAQAPEHQAICWEQRSYSYGELQRGAARIGETLAAHGIVPGDVVAVGGTPSFGLIAAMMGILSSRCVLLTLDPKLPQVRIKLMLQQARTRCLILTSPPGDGDEVMDPVAVQVYLDPVSAKELRVITGSVDKPAQHPADAAYVFFTSGTTGKPKAVLGSQRGLSHFLNWERQQFDVGPKDRCALLTGLSFDVVLRDIFLPLISGAALCLPGESDVQPFNVADWLERQGVTLFHAVPSVAQAWLGFAGEKPAGMAPRWVFFAGEPLPDSLVRHWRRVFPKTGGIANFYGPTETTLAKCFYCLPDSVAPGAQPVGSPLPQTQALVMGAQGTLCGIGEPGEVWIRTPFRSLGYLNSPEENKTLFVPNPLSQDPEDLCYRTGDRGVYHSDGRLGLLGRLDHQVKIRGVRIEPGEIETLLRQHPSILQAAVMARLDRAGNHCLAAYVVLENQTSDSGSQSPAEGPAEDAERDETFDLPRMRRFLQTRLPEPMIPNVMIALETMPLTANGKLDRGALPVPDAPHSEEAYVAPRNAIEAKLAKIWSEVLGLKRVGVHDNFFDIGGHSLIAAQVVYRMNESFPTEDGLIQLFNNPTIAENAARLERMVKFNQLLNPESQNIDEDREEIKI